MEVNIQMWINRRPRLSPPVYNSLRSFVDFKAEIHNVYIKVHKDPAQNWTTLPFIAIDDTIFFVLESWPPEWHAPDLAKKDRIVAQN